MENIYFFVAGIALFLVALYLIIRNINVTSGHALTLGLAFALIAFPHVANLEWSDDGFKFTTKQQGLQLTEQLEALSTQQKQANDTIAKITEALETTQQQIRAMQETSRGTTGQAPAVPAFQQYNDAFFRDLNFEVQKINNNNQATQESLEQLKRSLAPQQ